MASNSLDPLNVTLVVRRKTSSVPVLRSILAKLKHLDLTGKIRFESAVMKTHGGYADVFIGYATSVESQRPGEVKVAIKRLRIHIQGDSDFAKNLSKEIRVWSRLDHPNVLAFLGYALEGEDYPLLISEWMENGTSMSYVNENPECDITNMILGIAKGLAYLHSQGVVHADMKADNVLVSACGQPRICDFGISSILAASTTFGATSSHSYGARGSLRWMAMEFFEFTSTPVLHSERTDVWAFGMTVNELLTRQIPYAHIKLDPQVLLAIMRGILPPQPEQTLNLPDYAPLARVWYICQECWRNDPAARPTMQSIVFALSVIQRSDLRLYARKELLQTAVDNPLAFRTWAVSDTDSDTEFSSDRDTSLEGRASAQRGSENRPHTISPSSSKTSIDAQELFQSTSLSDPATSSVQEINVILNEWGSERSRGVPFQLPSPVTSDSSGKLMLSPTTHSPSASSLSTDDTILKEGYLAEVLDDPVFRLYTTRYFVLGPSSLRYYRRLGGELLGRIDVIHVQLPDEQGRRRGYENAFMLITSQCSMGSSDEAASRILYSESQSECEEWVTALQQMAKNPDNEESIGRSYTFPHGLVTGQELGTPGGGASASTVSFGTYLKQSRKTASHKSRLTAIFRRFTS